MITKTWRDRHIGTAKLNLERARRYRLAGKLADSRTYLDVAGQHRGFAYSETFNVIRLYNVQGNTQLSGVDSGGNAYTVFETDYFAEQELGECALCGEELESGWLCLDGGDEYCDDHVLIAHRK